MGSASKAGVIGAVAGIAIALIGVWGYVSMSGGSKDIPFQSDTTVHPSTGTSMEEKVGSIEPIGKKPVKPSAMEEKVGSMEPIEKKPVKPSAVDRVFPRIMKGQFVMTGCAEDAKWGIGTTANFQYSVFVIAESEILSKKALPNGNINVEEIRTFRKVQDSVVVSDVDFKLVLDTLPLDTFSKAIDAAAVGWASLTGEVATSATVLTTKKYVEQELRAVNGMGIRQLLGFVGFQPTAEIETMLNNLANAHIKKALGGIRSISGKSYKITYYQKKSGQPLLVTFTNKDGSLVTDEEEQMILKRVNSFIDYNMVPNTECRPGDSWMVATEDMQEVFDPYVEGKYTGEVKVTRKSNNDNGDWVVSMNPSVINVVADNGSTTGSLQLESGKAHINPQRISINELNVAGKAKLTKLSRHNWLFTARISGLCEFQGRVITEAKE